MLDGHSFLRSVLDAALGSRVEQSLHTTDTRPTNYYFAYGSNLHLRQMRRRCPGSKYIGRAKLSDYRWQINERGYANVVQAKGHSVQGLVYEIDENDETRLDINEGVSKNAYSKYYLNVTLHRANTLLYRRPVSWIVEKGGPRKIKQQATEAQAVMAESNEPWQQLVLVYISFNCVTDAGPKEEYINRINFGITDAISLGIEDSYIQQQIRPFIPKVEGKPASSSSEAERPKKSASRTRKKTTSHRNDLLSEIGIDDDQASSHL